ncbi:hypothetical protein SD77_4173 [Bacillus badius]|uniref:Uncharacterized protein n=1 Tax=Bacillus badius TaxID=1455 RepID=A0ABR5AUT2_BACBA|nr:hypothetical protein SD78_0477 [Bacillus badius]KIL78493.1 hypothetical protein SD77_4173 [Bacillus badius]
MERNQLINEKAARKSEDSRFFGGFFGYGKRGFAPFVEVNCKKLTVGN